MGNSEGTAIIAMLLLIMFMSWGASKNNTVNAILKTLMSFWVIVMGGGQLMWGTGNIREIMVDVMPILVYLFFSFVIFKEKKEA
jgi:hypothetical protein